MLLRRLTVESYERLSQTPYDYLNPHYYLETSPGSVTRLLEDLDGQYRRTNPHHHEAPVPSFEQVVDSFSLGLLSRFITQYRPDAQNPILFWKPLPTSWKYLSLLLKQSKIVDGFRNRVAHHDRLWASTSPEAARKARLFAKTFAQQPPTLTACSCTESCVVFRTGGNARNAPASLKILLRRMSCIT